jgi:hypothetical protein
MASFGLFNLGYTERFNFLGTIKGLLDSVLSVCYLLFLFVLFIND